MARKVLTDRLVDSTRGSGKPQNFFDEKAPGLCLRVSGTGSKSWYYVYRAPGIGRAGNSKWLGIGTYPAVKLADARTQALKHRHTVEVDKRDPGEEIKAKLIAVATEREEKGFTFADMCALYITFAKGKKKTWYDDEAKINNVLIPAWGDRPLKSITRQHVHDLLDVLQADGMGVGVNRYQACISRIFTIALDRGRVDAHPVARMIKRFDEQASERVLSDAEIKALWEGLELPEHEGIAADYIRLRALTGQRGAEVAEIERSEIDLLRATWTIPAKRTKNGKPHIVPLSPTAKEIIKRRLTAIDAKELRIFLGIATWSHQPRKLNAIHGGAYDWQDLRRTVATRLGGLGFDDTTIGRVLNHAKVSVTSKHYNQHEYTEEKRRALDAWDRELRRIVAGKAAKVVPLRQRA